MRSPVMNGRTASCTTTISTSSSTSFRPCCTDSWRVAPPGTTFSTFLSPYRSTTSFSARSRSSLGTTRITSVTPGVRSSTRSAWSIIGTPSSIRNCFGVPAPIRLPVPPAGTTATTLPAAFIKRSRSDGSIVAHGHFLGFRLFLQAGKDHATGLRLQDAGDHHGHGQPDEPLGVVHDDHRSVVQVGHALPGFLPFLQHKDPELLARQ